MALRRWLNHPTSGRGEVSVRGLQRPIGLKYERDPKRGTRGKPGGKLKRLYPQFE